MNDEDVQAHIEELVKEEHGLLESHGSGGLAAEQRERLEAVRVELDRYWDLLRQRRAHEQYGLDPEGASIRDAETVEDYEG